MQDVLGWYTMFCACWKMESTWHALAGSLLDLAINSTVGGGCRAPSCIACPLACCHVSLSCPRVLLYTQPLFSFCDVPSATSHTAAQMKAACSCQTETSCHKPQISHYEWNELQKIQQTKSKLSSLCGSTSDVFGALHSLGKVSTMFS